MRRALLLLTALWVCPGCPAHTDYMGAQRLGDHTAYTLGRGEFLVGIGFPGNDFETVGGTVRLEYGVLPGFEVGTNLGRTVAGIPNLHAEYTFLDRGGVALSVRAGLTWLNPKNVWPLPKEARSDVGDVNLFYIPLSLTVSLPVARFMHVHFEASYRAGIADGSAGSVDAGGKAGVGSHEIVLRPAAAFYPGAGVALLVGVEVPVYSSVQGLVEAETLMAPGVVSGVRMAESLSFKAARLVTVYSAVHIAWRHFQLRLSATYGLRFFAYYLPLPVPGVDLYWRF